MEIVALKRPPSDLADRLRELADQADQGRLTGAVIAYISDGMAFVMMIMLGANHVLIYCVMYQIKFRNHTIFVEVI